MKSKIKTAFNCPDDHGFMTTRLESWVYQLRVTDADAVCAADARVEVLVKPCGIYAPEAFSPHDGQRNEIFYVFGAAPGM